MDNKIKNRLYFLNKLFNFDKKFNINEKNIDNVYLNPIEWCCNYIPKPLINDIEPFEWNKMILELIKIYNSNNESNTSFYLTIPKYENKTLTIDIDDLQLNETMLKYIQCRPNIKILTQFSQKKLNFENYHLYGIKKIKLSLREIECLLYQLFCLTRKLKNYDDIKKFTQILNIKIEKTITIYVYENKSNINDLNYDISQDFISDNFITSIHHGQLYFNNNSLLLLKEMLLERYLNTSFQKSRFLLNTLKKMCHIRNLTLLEQSKILALGGNVLATYGLRSAGDLDIIVANLPEQLDDSFISKTFDIFFNKNDKLFFLDFYHPKINWETFWDEWHVKWGNMFGANNILECVYNPKFHYYFCGVKLLILNAEIARRNCRGRPAAIADLLMINRFLHKNIILNPISKKVLKLDVETITHPKKFIDIVKFWIKKKYNDTLTESEINNITFIQ